jgi:hypothetical protein
VTPPLAAQTLRLARLLHRLEHESADLGGTLGNQRPGLLERLDLVARRSFTARDDGSGVSHPSSGGCRAAGNEPYDGLTVCADVVLREILGRVLLHRAANLADEDDALGARVGEKDLDDVDVLRAEERVAADTDGEGLAQPSESGLAAASAPQVT